VSCLAFNGARKGFMNRCECIARYCGPRDTEEVDRTYMKAMLDDPGFVVIQGRAGQLVAACILCEQNTRSVIVEGMTRSETTSNFVQRMHEEHRLKELSCSEHVDWIDDPSNHHVNWTYRESSKGQQTWYNRKSAQVINYNPITTWDDHPHLARPVVIYSHGTSETAHKAREQALGNDWHGNLRAQADVLVYEYAGYGVGPGDATEKELVESIETAYRYVTEQLHVPSKRVILFGYSLGCCLAIDLAIKSPVGGLILQSAPSSIIRSQLGPCSACCRCCDMFDNRGKMAQLRCPVLMIHGDNDELCPIGHAKEMYEALPEDAKVVEPLWVPEGTHSRPVTRLKAPHEYDDSIKRFLVHCGTDKPCSVALPIINETGEVVPSDECDKPVADNLPLRVASSPSGPSTGESVPLLLDEGGGNKKHS